MWILLAIGSALFAGAMSILAKIGIKNVDSTLATALRTIVVVIFAWLMVLTVGSFPTITSISTKSLVALVLSGLATGGSWLCYFKALQIGDVNKVVPVDKSSTVLTMILAFFVLGEPIGLVKGIAIILIGTGTYMMIEKKASPAKASPAKVAPTDAANATPTEETEKGSFAWLIYAAGSAVFASLVAILGKIGISGVESNLGVAIRTVVVLVMAWLIVFMQNKQGGIKHIDKKSWLFLGLSGLATGGSWMCLYRALQEGPASIVVPIDKLSILVTVSFSFFILKEKIKLKSWIGLALIVAGTLSMVIFK